ncbi:MAG: aryl-sulfate sulfotransferase [Sphingobacteriaceae bacterium]|nr:aryl-sulfate sulfotransferase [Sphingobacteriaceae bacterium]
MTKRFYFLVLASLLLVACSKNKPDPYVMPPIQLLSDSLYKPSQLAPLSAQLQLRTANKTTLKVRVEGKNGPTSDLIQQQTTASTQHTITLVGLYPNYNNTIEITLSNPGQAPLTKIYRVQTAPLPSNLFPNIQIDTKTAQMAPGLTLVSYFGYQSNPFPQSPFMFDAFGDIRWYLDFSTHPSLQTLFYDDGMEQLQNGNLYFGDGSTNTIYEIDFAGNILNTWPLPGFGFHHQVLEKPNGNFLVSVSKLGESTIEDFIIEIDRQSKQIINTWDLRQSLQYNRQTLSTNPTDWIHVNALAYDASDNCIIISGRTQGLIKLNAQNQVEWIMSPHKGWDVAGNGTNLTPYLLQPLNQNQQAITQTDVLQGNSPHPDFEWQWYQHAPKLMPNGNILLFDNGDNRNFGASSSYSRAVVYQINKANKTVKQVWQYGKSRGIQTYSRIVSDVDYLAEQNHIIFSPGAVNNNANYGKIVEIDYTSQSILFEATLFAPKPYYGITFHRTERITRFP